MMVIVRGRKKKDFVELKKSHDKDEPERVYI